MQLSSYDHLTTEHIIFKEAKEYNKKLYKAANKFFGMMEFVSCETEK